MYYLFVSWIVAICLSFSACLCADEISFTREIAPLLLKRCAGCHGAKIAEGAFRLDTFELLMEAGDSGEATVVAGEAESSEVYRRIIETDEDLRMPQEDDALAQVEIDAIRLWIQQGAHFDGSDRSAPLKSQLAARRHPAAPEIYRMPLPVMSISFSPDGHQLAVGGYHELLIWDLADGTLLHRIGNLPQRIQSILWLDDSFLIAGGTPGEYGEVAFIATENDWIRKVLVVFSDIALDAVVDSRQLQVAACSADRSTQLVEIETAQLLWNKTLHSSWVTGVAFSGDDRFIVTTSLDETVKIIESENGELFTTFNGHRQQMGDFSGRFKIYDVGFHSASGRFMTAGEGRAIRVWDPLQAKAENGTAADMEERFYEKAHTKYVVHDFHKPVHKLVTSDTLIVVAGGDGMVKAFDADNHKPIRQFAGHEDAIYSLAVSQDGQSVAAGAHDGRVLVWNVESAKPPTVFLAVPTIR